MDILTRKKQIPEHFYVDDSMLEFPKEHTNDVEIIRGPNIGNPPYGTPLENNIHGIVTLKAGDKITTDHIMPAGQRLKYRSNIPQYAHYTFEGVDPTFHDRCKEQQEKGTHNIVVAGSSYGQGSSREHAAICPMYLGVKVIITKSFERIHHANLINFGILPLEFIKEAQYDETDQNDMLSIEHVFEQIEEHLNNQTPIIVKNSTKDIQIETTAKISHLQVAYLKAGGLLEYTKTHK